MGEKIDCIWASFLLGIMLCFVGLLISVPRKMHTLVLMSALAPVLIPLGISGVLLLHCIKSWCANRVHDGPYTNTSHDATAPAVHVSVVTEMPTPQPPDPPIITGIDIESLPTYRYDKEAVEGGLECPICRELYKKGDEIVQLPCIHPFHKKCIKPWLKTHQTCPICRCRVDLEIPRDVALIID